MRKLIVLLNEIKEYKNKLSIVLFLIILLTVINVLQPLITRTIIDEGLYEGKTDLVIRYSILALGMYVVEFFIGLIKEKIRIGIKNSFNKNLWNKIIQKTYRIKLSTINSRNTVELVQCLSNDVSVISGIFDDSAMFAITEILGVVGGVIGLFVVSYRMAFFIILFIPIKLIEVYFMSKKNVKIMQSFIQSMQEFSKWIGQYVDGIKDIRLWGLFEKANNSFIVKKDKELNISSKRSILTYLHMNIDNLLIETVIAIIYIMGSFLIEQEKVTIGCIVVFITYTTYILAPLSSVFNIFFSYAGIKPSLDRIRKFLNEEDEISEQRLNVKNSSIIDIKDVSVFYENFEAISNINLKLQMNQKNIIFGKNGCGKTTLMNLLLRLETANRGHIYIDNVSIDSIDIELYRKNMAVILTNFYLFNDTIINNICVDCKCNLKKLNVVLEVCGLMDLISQKGIEYLVGENGEHLSAGQRQKICIARALMSDRNYLFMDEATSNLDIESKNKILNYIFSLDRGVIMISHDKDTFKYADKIIYVKDGKIYDEGTLEELMKRNDYFMKEIREL